MASTHRSLALSLLLALVALGTTACPPPYPKCKNDSHCTGHGEVCVDGLCKECRTDKECKQGFVCKSNACVPAPECQVDTDCKNGLKCRNQKCVPECMTDAECAPGEKCQNQKCVAAAECTSDADCPSGQKCENQKCVAGPAQESEDELRRKRLEACTLETVPFDFNDFDLSDAARQTLDQDADCIKFKAKPVLVAGHADERGTEEYNLVLGEKRADSVKRYLVGLGVDAGLLKTISYGEERPVDRAHNEAAWAKNRRAELSFR